MLCWTELATEKMMNHLKEFIYNYLKNVSYFFCCIYVNAKRK